MQSHLISVFFPVDSSQIFISDFFCEDSSVDL
jgi:hypothetical protein